MVRLGSLCAIHLPVINAGAFFANLAMLIKVVRDRKKPGKEFFLYGCLNACNLMSSSLLFLPATVSEWQTNKGNSEHPLYHVSIAGRCIIICSNCGFNVAIAYSRKCVVTNPFKYSNATTRKILGRKAALAVVVTTIGFTSLISLLSAVTKVASIANWAVTAVQIATYVALLFLYWKLFVQYKKRNEEILPALGRSEVEERKRQERHMKRLFIGVTTSFIVLNMPKTIVTKFASPDEASLCNSAEGALTIFAATFAMLNSVFDPFWFFYLLWRRNRERNLQISAQNQVAVLPGNSKNELAIVS